MNSFANKKEPNFGKNTCRDSIKTEKSVSMVQVDAPIEPSQNTIKHIE